MHSFRAATQCLGGGLQHARLQYWTFRHYNGLEQERLKAFEAYQRHSPKCLHVGADAVALNDWFNTDLCPRVPGIYYLDATKPLPFPDGSFNFIFSEHMIEHIPFAAGLQFLRECRRILAPGGTVRLATPNLRNILALINNQDPTTEAYLKWAVETFNLPPSPFPKAPVVINNFFRSWGHQFLYDPETMQRTLEGAGFSKIEQQQVGTSAHAALQCLERHGEAIGQWVNEFETMVFEGSTL